MQRLLPIVVGVLLVIILAGGGYIFFLAPSGAEAEGEAAAAEAAPAKEALPPAPEPGEHGPIYLVESRTVNLADNGGRKYLKVSLALEFNEALPEGGGGHGPGPIAGWRQHIADSIGPQINDVLTMLLSSSTSEELLTTEGKEHLKEAILHDLNHALHADRILHVFFTDFIIQ